jgi:class 3 adenylate cyclase
MREMHVDVQLEATSSGTRIHYNVDAVPRHRALTPIVAFVIGVVSQVRFRRLFMTYALQAARDPHILPVATALPLIRETPAALAGGGRERLQAAADSMVTIVNPELIDHLVQLVRFGDDSSLLRIRPYAVADMWGLPRTGVLRAFLHATRAGMMSLQWDVVCPMCRGAKSSADTLSELQSHVYCECCHANIDVDEFERSVELTFRPSPAIRMLDAQPYCVGGPMVTPHIVVQQLMPAKSSRSVPLRLDPGDYRLRSLDRAGGQSVMVSIDEPASSHVEIPAGDWPADDAFIGKRTMLSITNESDTDELLIIERRAWADDAITAAEAFRLQDFRDLFSRETLRAGQHLAVGSVAVLFTDVRESTRLYRDIGDAVAFARIREHFDVLRNAVILENGVVVKTIGDAVMAVFETPTAGLRAVLRAAEMLGAEPSGVQPLQLKAGLHFGPCIAVTLNDALDYFGSTVNIAARLGALSIGGDIVISDAAFGDGELAELATSLELESTDFDALLKGVSDVPMKVWRLSGKQRAAR